MLQRPNFKVRLARRILTDRRGSTLAMMAAGLIPIIAAIGSAIDLGRIYIVTSQMQTAVDAAALAGASAYDNSDDSDPSGRYQQIVAYYKDNFTENYMGIQPEPSAKPVVNSQTLLVPQFSTVNGIAQTAVSASGRLPMTFMSLFSIAPKSITATAKAEFQPHPLEVQVVLDNTGSLQDTIDGVSKIDALKKSMHNFINVLYQGSSNPRPQLAMGIINYTNVVNVGSILAKYNVPVEALPGFTDTSVSWEAGNSMGWKGCVANDDTTNTMSSSLSVRENNAFDIWNSLPGEYPTSDAQRPMPNIKPFLSPPSWIPQNGAVSAATTPTGENYKVYAYGNLYPAAAQIGDIANNATWSRYFYRYYIHLNDNGNSGNNGTDDVIVKPDGSYYDPAIDGKNNAPYYVRPANIPNKSAYSSANIYVNSSNSTSLPSPNWQCPEPGIPITYNVPRSQYDNYIDQHVWAIQPSNGTMHHTGFIWGWRLLSRYTVFKRSPPAGPGTPVRALVFMTDGKTDLSPYSGSNDRVFTAYGAVSDKTITTGDDTESVKTAANLRFAKSCSIANSYTFPDSHKTAQIYVVVINKGSDVDTSSQARLKACGSSGYWLTTNATQLNTAFSQIARTLVDVHLTQ